MKDEFHLMDQDMAQEFVVLLLESLAKYPIKTAEGFRNAALGKGIYAVNPVLGLSKEDSVDWLRNTITKTISEGRMIDFGFLPNELIKEESIRSRPMYEAGELQHPYETWIGISAWEGGMNGYYVAPHPGDPSKTLVIELYGIDIPKTDGAILIYDIIAIEVRGIGDTVVMPVVMQGINETDEIKRSRGANSLDPLVTMLRLLADASIPVVDHPAPVKLNKHRAKQGKFLIPPHAAVHTRDYVSSFMSPSKHKGEGKGGHHASPISHWRRAHKRHLSDGRVIPVRSSKVNWRETEELHRLFYRVPEKKDKTIVMKHTGINA